jgi:hypothetical protein
LRINALSASGKDWVKQFSKQLSTNGYPQQSAFVPLTRVFWAAAGFLYFVICPSHSTKLSPIVIARRRSRRSYGFASVLLLGAIFFPFLDAEWARRQHVCYFSRRECYVIMAQQEPEKA